MHGFDAEKCSAIALNAPYRTYWLVFIPVVFVLFISFRWFFDIITEATFEGHHTIKVQNGLRLGVYLFIVSEVMFFFSFFVAFFYTSLAPSAEIGW